MDKTTMNEIMLYNTHLLMKEKKINQKKLAEGLNIRNSTLSMKMSAKGSLISILPELSEYFNVSPAFFLNDNKTEAFRIMEHNGFQVPDLITKKEAKKYCIDTIYKLKITQEQLEKLPDEH